MRIAILGPGGVGGFLAGALARAGEDVTVVAREETAAAIEHDGLHVRSARLGEFTAHPRAVPLLGEDVDVLVIATKATSLDAALVRVDGAEPQLVVPLLNGFEHLGPLRARYGDRAVAGTIRIGAERTAPGEILHTSPFLRVDVAPPTHATERFAHKLRAAEVPTKVLESEPRILWSKLVRLAPLALATSAADGPIGTVWTHPHRRVLLEGAVREAAAVAGAEGAPIDPAKPLGELAELPPDQTSSLHRDLAAGNPSELDAIGGAVQRAGARHGIPTPSIDALVAQIRERYPAAQ